MSRKDTAALSYIVSVQIFPKIHHLSLTSRKRKQTPNEGYPSLPDQHWSRVRVARNKPTGRICQLWGKREKWPLKTRQQECILEVLSSSVLLGHRGQGVEVRDVAGLILRMALGCRN